ncbi:MAG: ABC transporter substrate-binding protein [Candidatus Lambdaproteobacteria bacterium]|nr:ABC transporter substrate-binding protein [Candidatus Lambdaproteobacteria bacterium]
MKPRRTMLLVAGLGVLALAIVAAALLLRGRADPARQKLILDWFPNADHVPLYVAREAGLFAKHGLEIEIVAPADPNDPLKLVAAGQAAFGINYQPNVIMARAEGLPIRSVGVLVEHPLSSLAFLKKSGIKTPKDLKGKKIGYSVQALELALLKGLAESAGLKESDYTTVNVNFNLTSALLSGQVDAVMGAYWVYELPELELEKQPGDYFALNQHGVPDYYELIVITNDDFLQKRPEAVRQFVAALDEAIAFCRAKPAEALAMYFKANPQVRKELDERAFKLVLPLFATTQQQKEETWAGFVKFAQGKGLIKEQVPTERLYRNVLR